MSRMRVYLAREGGVTYSKCPVCERPAKDPSAAHLKRLLTAHLLDKHAVLNPDFKLV